MFNTLIFYCFISIHIDYIYKEEKERFAFGWWFSFFDKYFSSMQLTTIIIIIFIRVLTQK